jgi:hypothetical protein
MIGGDVLSFTGNGGEILMRQNGLWEIAIMPL